MRYRIPKEREALPVQCLRWLWWLISWVALWLVLQVVFLGVKASSEDEDRVGAWVIVACLTICICALIGLIVFGD